MSDKKNISIEDRGWQDMHSILDKEMPQKKNRRIAPWFFFGLFCILGMVFLGSKLFEYSNNQILTSSFDEKSQIQKEIKNVSKFDQNLNTGEETASNESHLIKSDDSNFESSNSSKIRKQGRDADVYTNATSQKIKEQLPKENIKINLSSETKENDNSQVNIKSEYGIQRFDPSGLSNRMHFENDELEKSEMLENIDRKLSPLVPLELLGPQSDLRSLYINIPFIIELNPEGTDKQVKPIAAVEATKVLSPYLFGVGNYQSSINGKGYGLGAGLSYKVNKFGVYFDVSYSKSNYDIGEVSNDFSTSGSTVELDDNTNTEVFESVSLDGENLKFENFSNLTSSISEVKLNIGLRRAISRKLSIDFGLGYSRLLKVNNKPLSVDLVDPTSLNPMNTINIGSSELFTTGAYAKYDIIPHIGIEYNFLPGAYIGIHYNHGLKNVIARTEVEYFNSLSENESIFRRNFEAKLRFQF